MTVLVDKMEYVGFVRRETSKVDSRSTVVRLTERGESLRGAFESISSRFVSMLYYGISEKEVETVERILAKILSNTEKQKGKTP